MTPSAGHQDDVPLPPPGLVFEDSAGTWLVNRDGQMAFLTAHTGVDVSPDGQQGLVCVEGDVVLLDFRSGAEINLTEGSGRVHYSAVWWPARPDTVVMTSVEPSEAGPNAGRLTLVKSDGTDYRVVQQAEKVSFAFPAPAPDGEMIAFDAALEGRLYHRDGTIEAFNPEEYDFPEGVEVVRMGSPAWSPDGRRLAWMLGLRGGGYGAGEVWDCVLGVFDLEARTVILIHPFRPAGRGGWLRPAVWSPDGRWLTFDVESVDQTENGLWLTNAQGTSQQRLRAGAGYPVLWRPAGDEEYGTDGPALVIARPRRNQTEENWLVVGGEWRESVLPLPGAPVAWLPLPDDPAPLPHSEKGYELYSWQVSDGIWRYTLITGTNRPKTVDELISGDDVRAEDGWVKVTVTGGEALVELLDRVPAGEEIFWRAAAVAAPETTGPVQCRLPDGAVVTAVEARCRELGLRLVIMAGELEAVLTLPEVVSTGEPVPLTFVLINRARDPLYVLKWYTPLEGIAGEIFRVTRDGEPLTYQGILAMRGDPGPEDYVLLEPGGSVSATVTLEQAYDFSQPGVYAITFLSPRISHVARTETGMAQRVDELGPVTIGSNTVTVAVAAAE